MDITQKEPPILRVPASPNTVRVRAIDTTTRMVCNAGTFVEPSIKGHERLNFDTMCFLVDHATDFGTEHVLFDCGARKDYWNSPPSTKKMIGTNIPALEIQYGVDEILTMNGFDLEDLSMDGICLDVFRNQICRY